MLKTYSDYERLEKASTHNVGDTYEFATGTGGDGNRVYLIYTMRNGKACIHIERFKSKHEAICWWNWSCQ
jgi:hypothetical protein